MKSETPEIPSPWSNYLDDNMEEEKKQLVQSHSLGLLDPSKTNFIFKNPSSPSHADSNLIKKIETQKISCVYKCKNFIKIAEAQEA